jgi:hypothetical protein
MFNFVMLYWEFLNRPVPSTAIPTGIEMAPDFFLHTGIYTVGFLIVMAALPVLCKLLFPSWYNALAPKKKEELPAYISSFLHHFTVVPLSWYIIFLDFNYYSAAHPMDYTQFITFAAPFCTSFVLADTIFYALPMCLRGNFEYILHHILAMWMDYALMTTNGHLLRYLPHIIICDTTNAVFNVAWLMRLTGFNGSPVLLFFESIFALLFFVLRCINLSTTFWILFFHDNGNSFGHGKWVFPFLSLMQFYWLSLIYVASQKKLGISSKVKKAA